MNQNQGLSYELDMRGLYRVVVSCRGCVDKVVAYARDVYWPITGGGCCLVVCLLLDQSWVMIGRERLKQGGPRDLPLTGL